MRRYGMSEKEVALMNTFRKLWVQHVMWTRSFIISTAANLGDEELVAKRLLQNPSDFANELKMFYGPDKAEKFRILLEQHLLIAADIVNAAKKVDKETVDAKEKLWYENADEIAKFLASINQYWDEKEWKKMLYEHLKMTEDEAVDRLNGNYEVDIQLYGKIEQEALNMADYMTTGIIRQFRY